MEKEQTTTPATPESIWAILHENARDTNPLSNNP
jgi:hypothetical protein